MAQIPALFIAITAGIIVTRGNSEDSINLGADIGSQVLAQPNALLIGSAILFGFALIPGFPTWIFVSLAIIAGLLGLVLIRIRSQEGEATLDAVETPAGDGGQSGTVATRKAASLMSPPIVIELAEAIRDRLDPVELNEQLGRVRRGLFEELGVPFPGVHLRFNSDLEDDRYVIYLNDIPAARGYIGNGKLPTIASEEELQLLDLPWEKGEPLLPGLTPLLVDATAEATLREHDIPVLSPAYIMAMHLAWVLRRNAAEFIGVQETHQLLSQLEDEAGELVKEAQRIVPLNRLAQILRRLVDEDISIRNLRGILETLVEWGGATEDPELLTEHVRAALKKQISYQFSEGQNILPIYLMDPAAEMALQNYIRQTPGGSLLGLGPEDTRNLINAIRHAVTSHGGARPAPLLTSFELRPLLRKLIRMDFQDLPVLSYEELSREVTVQPLAKIDFQPAGA